MLKSKTVLISGASSGFGNLTVRLLLEKGHTVIAGLRGGQKRLETVFGEELKEFPGRLHAVDLHLEKSSDFGQVAKLLDTRFEGRLDVLINNAGYGLMGVLEDQSEEQIRYQMEVNFLGTALLTRALLPALRKAKGRILSVTSLAGLVGFPFYGTYCASKFAVEGLMEALRYDLKPFGVRVGLIEPGGFKTDFVRAKLFGEGSENPASPYFHRTQAFLKVFEMTSARLDDPMKVARLISKRCDSRRLPLHNVVGRDAWLVRFMQMILPEQVRLALTEMTFNFALAKASPKRRSLS